MNIDIARKVGFVYIVKLTRGIRGVYKLVKGKTIVIKQANCISTLKQT